MSASGSDSSEAAYQLVGTAPAEVSVPLSEWRWWQRWIPLLRVRGCCGCTKWCVTFSLMMLTNLMDDTSILAINITVATNV
jgi:hypothetical protein